MTKPLALNPVAFQDIMAVAGELRTEPGYAKEGHTARTLTREDDLRVVLIVMNAGSSLPEHRASATVSVQVIRGRVHLKHPVDGVELHTGQLLILQQGLSHDVTALDESVLLLTLGWHPKHS